MAQEVATLAGGCFWCVEAVYDALKGVEDVVSGYMGGQTSEPSYEAVCTGSTGHAEVVQIKFDPAVISYEDVLNIFFTIHDPTTLNRQGGDIGTQYRSAVFYHTAEQKAQAEATIKALDAEQVWADPIITEITEASTFWPAEDYHQEYFANHPEQGYCQAVVAPKVAKFRKRFYERLKA